VTAFFQCLRLCVLSVQRLINKWHAPRPLEVQGSCIGCHGNSSRGSYTCLLEIGEMCVRKLAKTWLLLIGLCQAWQFWSRGSHLSLGTRVHSWRPERIERSSCKRYCVTSSDKKWKETLTSNPISYKVTVGSALNNWICSKQLNGLTHMLWLALSSEGGGGVKK
jgi:hypothetical protein